MIAPRATAHVNCFFYEGLENDGDLDASCDVLDENVFVRDFVFLTFFECGFEEFFCDVVIELRDDDSDFIVGCVEGFELWFFF
jgi:hypothetical protein